MPPQTGRVAVVTGGGSGIGTEVVRHLVQHGARVYVLSRSLDKTRAALDKLRTELEAAGPSPGVDALGETRIVKCDLASLASVREAAKEVLALEPKLDLLFANAGVSGATTPSAEGHEAQFATNCLGHHVLIQLLLPAVRAAASAPDTTPKSTRIIITSSGSHSWTPRKMLQDLHDPKTLGYHGRLMLYGRSKLGNIYTASRLAEDLADEGIVVMAVHPGSIQSEIGREAPPGVMWVLNRLIFWPTYYGSIALLWGGTSPEAGDLSGKYLEPWTKVVEPSELAKDKNARDKVWNWCQEQMKITE